jgi:hypothetical protein
MEPYKLTRAERLMILNSRPTSDVELYLMIEELDGRLDEKARERLLEDIQRTLLP